MLSSEEEGRTIEIALHLGQMQVLSVWVESWIGFHPREGSRNDPTHAQAWVDDYSSGLQFYTML